MKIIFVYKKEKLLELDNNTSVACYGIVNYNVPTINCEFFCRPNYEFPNEIEEYDIKRFENTFKRLKLNIETLRDALKFHVSKDLIARRTMPFACAQVFSKFLIMINAPISIRGYNKISLINKIPLNDWLFYGRKDLPKVMVKVAIELFRSGTRHDLVIPLIELMAKVNGKLIAEIFNNPEEVFEYYIDSDVIRDVLKNYS